MVAIPVHDKVSTPGPKYSIILPVPPLTVNNPTNFKITSLGEAQPYYLFENFLRIFFTFNCPVSLTPNTLGALSSHGIPLIASTASAPFQNKKILRKFWSCTSDTNSNHTKTTCIGSVGISTKHKTSRK